MKNIHMTAVILKTFYPQQLLIVRTMAITLLF